MIKKPFIQNKPPFIPPNRFDDRSVSKQIYKNDNSTINNEMASVIISANPTEILNFFAQNPFTAYTDQNGNTPIHLIVLLEDVKLNEQQKIDIINQLIVPPYNLTVDSTNNRGETPLHIAVKKQFGKIVKYLVEKGANANKINYLHQNSLHLAMIPNVKPCERQITPEPLIDVDQNFEDKNIAYNKILAVFYNKRNDLEPIIKLINDNVGHIFGPDGYYSKFKHSKIFLSEPNKIGERLTPVDVAIQDIQNKITQNILNSKINDSDIKKNISYYVVNGLGKIISAYEDFISASLNEINLDSRIIDTNTFKVDDIIKNEIMKFKAVGNSNLKLDQDAYLKSRQDEVMTQINKENNSIKAILTTFGGDPSTINSGNNLGAYYDGLKNVVFAPALDENQRVELNKLLINHINNLNLWLAYENMKTDKFVDDWSKDQLPALASITNIFKDDIPYKSLDYFLILSNNQFSKIGNIPPAINVPDVASKIGPLPDGTAIKSSENVSIPNSFNAESKDFDFINLLKKHMISYLFKNMNTKEIPPVGGPPVVKAFDDIWTQTETIIKSQFAGLNEINDLNIYYQTMTTIIQVFDRIMITNIRNKIYLESVKLLKEKLMNDPVFQPYKTRVETFFNKMLVKANVAIKLDKTINDMISLNGIGNINNGYNINDIIDEEKITNIFAYDNPIDRSEISTIYTKENGDYLLFYGSDYNSINELSTRQCMRNSSLIVKNLFLGNQNPDIFKIDINGYTPIFYAIKNGNYLLVREILKTIRTLRNITIPLDGFSDIHPLYYIQNQLNKYYESPIYFAYKQFKSNKEILKPDWPMINVTYMNNLLLSAQINQNIPKDYYDSYKILIYHLNQFVQQIMANNFYNFGGICNITNPIKPFFVLNPPNTPPNISTTDFAAGAVATTINVINFDFIKFDDLLEDLNALTINKKSIKSVTIGIETKKTSINFNQTLDSLKNLVNIFEEKYKPQRLYKYDNVMGRPETIIVNPNPNLKESNRYYVLLIAMGIISIKRIISRYFHKIVLKLLYTSNALNFDSKANDNITPQQLNATIKDFIDQNIFDFVRIFYMIKIDQYDRLVNASSNSVSTYMNKLIESLIQNGLLMPNSEIEQNIKQYVVPHIGELISKTLKYNQIIIDILHKHTINLYYSMKTFDELSKFV
jgi:ankyrin repeat protein